MKAVLLILMVLLGLPASSVGQAVLTLDEPLQVTLAASEKRTVQLAEEPGTVALFELDLQGGLLAVASAEAPRRVLDLGRGGRLWFAVAAGSDGFARIELSSAEQARPATVTVSNVTTAHPAAAIQHLRAAGIAFAKADSARRRLPNAPSAAEALQLYDTAAAEAQNAGDVSLARWTMAQKARYLMYQKSSFVQTRTLLQQAAALPDDGDEAVQALVLKTLSSAQYFTGNLPAAVDDAEQALALYRITGDVYWQGIVLGNLISTYSEAGRETDAVGAGREALADAEQTQDTAGVVFALTELGRLYQDEGQYQLAFQTYRDAQQWGESTHYAPLVEAEIEKELARFYVDLGVWDEARQQLRLCLRNAAPEGETALDARGIFARLLEQRHDHAGALREYSAALAIAKKLGLDHVEASLLLERATTYLDAGNVASARQDAIAVTQLAGHLQTPTSQIGIALLEGAIAERECASCPGAQPDPEAHYTEALKLARAYEMREGEAAAHAGLAHVFRARGDNDAALAEIDRALTLVEHSRSSLASRELAASYFLHRRDWYQLAIDTAMAPNGNPAGNPAGNPSRSPAGNGETAFRYAERARARAMLDIIGEGEVSTARPNQNLERRIAANEHQLERQRALLLTSADPQTIAPALRTLYHEQDALAAEAGQAGEPIDHHVADAAGNADAAGEKIATIHDVQTKLLEPGSAMLVFALGARHTYRWFITPARFSVSVLPAGDQLRRALQPLLLLLAERTPRPLPQEDASQYGIRREAWGAGRDRLLESAASLLLPPLPRTVHHLYIAADAGLSTLPWAGLRVPCGARPCYLIERSAISLEPSASIAVALTAHPGRPAGQAILVVDDAIRSQDRQALRWAPLPPLPGSHRESQSIARLVQAASFHELRGEQATLENVRTQASPSLDVLHLAAHTILVAGHPELSGIALSPGRPGTREVQSVLWLREIPSLHVPQLVVLSGCTTEGEEVSGEELTSLTQAFFYAGAQQVVATLWRVDDDAAASLIQRFYQGLFTHRLTAPFALQQAQLSMLHDHNDLSDWAAFVVNGAAPHPAASPPR